MTIYARRVLPKSQAAVRHSLETLKTRIAASARGQPQERSAYRWLSNNAKRFGFVNDVAGEFWHWT